MEDLRAARIYARALFAEAQKENQLPACQQGLEQALTSVRAEPLTIEVLKHPMVPPPEKQRFLHLMLGEFTTPLVERFFMLLIARHRLHLLALIVRDFQEAFDEFQGIQPLQVRTAFPFSEVQKQQLTLKLENIFQSKVRMEVQTDSQLIGGFVAQSKDYILDQSIAGHLNQLRQQLVASSNDGERRS